MLGTVGSVLGGAALSYLGGLDSAGGLTARLGSATQLSGSKKSLKQQLLYQKSYDKWKSNLDYEYSQKYAQNSARWQMEGLENAGLNPILAVTNGSMAGTFGNASSGSVSSSFHSARQRLDLAGAAAAVSHTAKENALLDAQIKQVDAQTKEIESKIRNTDIDTRNKTQTNGLSGLPAAFSVMAHKADLGGDSTSARDYSKSPIHRLAKHISPIPYTVRTNEEKAKLDDARAADFHRDLQRISGVVNSAKSFLQKANRFRVPIFTFR